MVLSCVCIFITNSEHETYQGLQQHLERNDTASDMRDKKMHCRMCIFSKMRLLLQQHYTYKAEEDACANTSDCF